MEHWLVVKDGEDSGGGGLTRLWRGGGGEVLSWAVRVAAAAGHQLRASTIICSGSGSVSISVSASASCVLSGEGVLGLGIWFGGGGVDTD